MEEDPDKIVLCDVIAEIASHADTRTIQAMNCVSRDVRMATYVETLKRKLEDAEKKLEKLREFRGNFVEDPKLCYICKRCNEAVFKDFRPEGCWCIYCGWVCDKCWNQENGFCWDHQREKLCLSRGMIC